MTPRDAPVDHPVPPRISGTDGASAAGSACGSRHTGERCIPLPWKVESPLIALGGAGETSICLVDGNDAWLTSRCGVRPTVDRMRWSIERLESARGVSVARFAVDGDLSSQVPDLLGGKSGARSARVEQVPHHLAHAAVVLAEHGCFPRSDAARGIRERAFVWILGDGAVGADGQAWGCELLAIDSDLGWSRLASAEPVPVVGRAEEQAWCRLASILSAYDGPLHGAVELPVRADDLRLFRQLALRARRRCRSLAGCFEALAALFGLVGRCVGRGVMRDVERGRSGVGATQSVESLAAEFRAPEGRAAVKRWSSGMPEVHPRLLSCSRLIEEAAARLRTGESPPRIARGFHRTLAWRIVELARAVLPSTVNTLGFAGESMANHILVEDLGDACRAFGFEPLFPVDVAFCDSSLAYGQAVLQSAASARGVTLREQPESDACRWPR